MTPKQLGKRVRSWMDRLRPLGLAHWTVHVRIVDEIDNPADAHASCSCSTHYNTMWLEFRQDFIDTAEEQILDKVIIHELLHAAMRDLDHVAEGVTEFLGEPHRSVYQDSLTHAGENLVERLAWTLTLAYS